MSEITLRRCANCAGFDDALGACSMARRIDGRSPTGVDVCPQHATHDEVESQAIEHGPASIFNAQPGAIFDQGATR